jgi:hypothetical protein
MDRLKPVRERRVCRVANILVAGAMLTASPVAGQWKPDTTTIATQSIEVGARRIETFAKTARRSSTPVSRGAAVSC